MAYQLKTPKPPVDLADPVNIDLALCAEATKKGRHEEALAIASKILDKDPNNAGALFHLAWAFIKTERWGLAYNLLKRAIEFKARPEALNNLGMACIGMKRFDEAEQIFGKLLKREGEYVSALSNMALVAVHQVNPAEAIEYGERVLKVDPAHLPVREAVGYAKLMLGDFRGGWDGYESMIGSSKQRPRKPPHDNCPYWMHEDGLNLYIRGEQGLGDEISFASILPDAMRDQQSITVECHPKMTGLFRRSFPGVEFHGTREIQGEAFRRDWLEGRTFDAWCLMGSLAQRYRNDASDFPGTPYLVADPQRRVQWGALLDTLPGKKVGIAWTGGTESSFRARRSFDLEALLPILKTPGVTWVSLQYQDPSDEIEHLREKHGIEIHHWKRASESDDYDDQAALVAELDLVISVCTAGVHLAGALGTECWTLVPAKARWFYQLKGDSLPWYRSVRMFRQTDKWPVERVAARLVEWLREPVKEAA